MYKYIGMCLKTIFMQWTIDVPHNCSSFFSVKESHAILFFQPQRAAHTSTQLPLYFSLHQGNVGEVRSSNYPISAFTVGCITYYAPSDLTHSPSQSIYCTCLQYAIAFPLPFQVHQHNIFIVLCSIKYNNRPVVCQNTHFTWFHLSTFQTQRAGIQSL